MEQGKIELNAQKILENVFTPNMKGYDPDEVDDYLDIIIKDYREFERFYVETNAYIKELEAQLRKAKERNSSLEVENARMSNRVSGIKEGDNVTVENVNLLQRISKLETALYQLGGDPTKIK